MTDEGYRGRLAALRASVADKRATVPAPGEFLTPVRRLLLRPGLVASIESCASGFAASPTDFQELLRLDGVLDELARHYEAARGALQATARARQLPAPAFPLRLGAADPTIASLGALVAELGGAEEPWGPLGGVGVRFVSKGVPFFLAVHSRGPVFSGRLRVAVPIELPALAVRLEGTPERLAAWLGVGRESTLGVRVFDQLFWIAGDERTARALLNPGVRTALRGLASRDPTFTVEDGVAEVGWSTLGGWGRSDLLPAEARQVCDEVVELIAAARAR